MLAVNAAGYALTPSFANISRCPKIARIIESNSMPMAAARPSWNQHDFFAVRDVLDDLKPVQLAHRHRDPFQPSQPPALDSQRPISLRWVEKRIFQSSRYKIKK
ncbi:hypothetical protein [Burkholderia cepacia]|uniref:hypothetical protein n=1 Tax=Burkholderia cepacia TaxID=292 RepID=UPI00115FE5E9|nr:hypothetical protein [Burkholderia cepacia]